MDWTMVNKCEIFNRYSIFIQTTLVDEEKNSRDAIMFRSFTPSERKQIRYKMVFAGFSQSE